MRCNPNAICRSELTIKAILKTAFDEEKSKLQHVNGGQASTPLTNKLCCINNRHHLMYQATWLFHCLVQFQSNLQSDFSLKSNLKKADRLRYSIWFNSDMQLQRPIVLELYSLSNWQSCDLMITMVCAGLVW